MKRVIVAAGVFAVLGGWANAALADDLRGYSIDATLVRNDIFRSDEPRSRDLTAHKRLYIGMAGDIFDYSDLSAGMYTEHEAHVGQADKATSLSRGRMRAWEIEGNRLKSILHVVEGFYVTTIQVDPSRTSCTVSQTTQSDPSTGRLVIPRLNGRNAEVVSSTLRSYTCTVKQGNIFAADR